MQETSERKLLYHVQQNMRTEAALIQIPSTEQKNRKYACYCETEHIEGGEGRGGENELEEQSDSLKLLK